MTTTPIAGSQYIPPSWEAGFPPAGALDARFLAGTGSDTGVAQTGSPTGTGSDAASATQTAGESGPTSSATAPDLILPEGATFLTRA